ncbi:hypothetical protein M6B38_127005 [Iris pallida]|uniref:Uncharacterized protein n=1 Tax=Iris pallida TaxID=29817 RepID=A0AAX6FPT8_IRIPA|nr:hypothetical protein M6B38_408450 [Iris pallida]KAJ6827469.1 hypothetical protein M6B38_127005 [Iris pallida]
MYLCSVDFIFISGGCDLGGFWISCINVDLIAIYGLITRLAKMNKILFTHDLSPKEVVFL